MIIYIDVYNFISVVIKNSDYPEIPDFGFQSSKSEFCSKLILNFSLSTDFGF